MTDTMKALLLGRGPQWVLDDVPVPVPGRGKVLVRNQAAATNDADLPMLAEADPIHGGSGKESIAGFEYAGEIAAVGPDAWPARPAARSRRDRTPRRVVVLGGAQAAHGVGGDGVDGAAAEAGTAPDPDHDALLLLDMTAPRPAEHRVSPPKPDGQQR